MKKIIVKIGLVSLIIPIILLLEKTYFSEPREGGEESSCSKILDKKITNYFILTTGFNLEKLKKEYPECVTKSMFLSSGLGDQEYASFRDQKLLERKKHKKRHPRQQKNFGRIAFLTKLLEIKIEII